MQRSTIVVFLIGTSVGIFSIILSRKKVLLNKGKIKLPLMISKVLDIIHRNQKKKIEKDEIVLIDDIKALKNIHKMIDVIERDIVPLTCVASINGMNLVSLSVVYNDIFNLLITL